MRQGCKISVITINYNGLEDTCGLIDSLPVDSRLEIVVVDNASSENEAAIIAARYTHVKTIRSEQNNGFSAGNNLGFSISTGDYLFFLNNDAYMTGTDEEKLNSLFTLIERLESNSHIALVCPKIRFAWDNTPIQFAGYTPLSKITVRNRAQGFGEPDHGQYDTPHPTPYVHGAAVMAKREYVEQVGLWPESFFLYYEEIDWSIMFARAGYEIWYEPGCTVYHKESRSTGQNSPLRVYYLTRNRLYLVRRHSPPIDKYLSYAYLIGIAYIKSIIIYTVQGHFGHAKAVISGIRDFILKRYGKQT